MFTDSWRTALRENVATDMGILRLSIIGWSGFCSSDHFTTDLWQVHCPSTNNSDKCVEARLHLAFCEFFFLTSIFFFSTISVRQQRFWMKYLLLLHRLTPFWKYGPCTTTTTSYNGQVTNAPQCWQQTIMPQYAVYSGYQMDRETFKTFVNGLPGADGFFDPKNGRNFLDYMLAFNSWKNRLLPKQKRYVPKFWCRLIFPLKSIVELIFLFYSSLLSP